MSLAKMCVANTLGGSEIDEESLNGSRIVGLAGNQAADCDPRRLGFL